eukprot:230244_1
MRETGERIRSERRTRGDSSDVKEVKPGFVQRLKDQLTPASGDTANKTNACCSSFGGKAAEGGGEKKDTIIAATNLVNLEVAPGNGATIAHDVVENVVPVAFAGLALRHHPTDGHALLKRAPGLSGASVRGQIIRGREETAGKE